MILTPFMIVARDHAVNDLAEDGVDSWKSRLGAAGFAVLPVLEGPGANDAFADLFLAHIEDAAHGAGITLKSDPSPGGGGHLR